MDRRISSQVKSVTIPSCVYQSDVFLNQENLNIVIYANAQNNNINIQLIPRVVGYRLSFGKEVIAHELTNSVITCVQKNIIDDFHTIPAFMQKSFILESKDASSFFYDDVLGITGGWFAGKLSLTVQRQYEYSYFTFRWNDEVGQFEGVDVSRVNGKVIETVVELIDIDVKLLRFLVTFSLVLECEKNPFQMKREKVRNQKKRSNSSSQNEWIINRVYIDGKYHFDGKPLIYRPMDKSNKMKEEVMIKQPFTRIQRVGKGRTKEVVKIIQPFKTHRWKKQGDRKTIVATRQVVYS